MPNILLNNYREGRSNMLTTPLIYSVFVSEGSSYTIPWLIMAEATFMKPATLAPLT